ncbi:T9SS type A sorting domain-containing protein [bacterium]|nr:T9SS type A sorting domain-containing protein [bacterium]
MNGDRKIMFNPSVLKFRNLVILCLFAAGSPGFLFSQQPAFPGAEGFGRFTTGGRGGQVIEVTNLNDSGSGSFRSAVQTYGTRTIVFRVSGTIELKSSLNIEYGNITIAGQTAPGDGICIKGYPVTVGASNVIIRYLRFRPGDETKTEADALSGTNRRDIMIDHCSMSWGNDEVASFYDNVNFTMQWCIISESLYSSYHYKGNHGYGGIWGGMGASFHHNLLAHHSSRNPRFQGSRYNSTPETEQVDHRNNVIFNWGGNSAYGGESGNQNLIANYYKSGPATSGGSVRYRIVECSDEHGHWYVADNYVDGYPDITGNNWGGGVQGFNSVKVKLVEPIQSAPVLTHDAEDAYVLVLENAGATAPVRDPVDTRIINEVRTGTVTYGGVYGAGKGIIDSQTEVGGWPELNTYDIPVDEDHDGMADAWETGQGLDSTDPEDHRGDIDSDGYTNLENYINGLCVRDDFVLPAVDLEATALSATEIRLSWKEIAQAETGFSIERAEGEPANFVVIAVTNPNDTVYHDLTGVGGYNYYYRIRTMKDPVYSIYSNVAAAKTSYPDGRPAEADEPSPADGALGVSNVQVLGWKPGTAAVSHDVYFGTANPPVFQGSQTGSSFDPRGLLDETTYYWRVDEVNEAGKTQGDIWQFTTEPFTRGLAAHWKFDRGLGSLDLDASGHSNYAYLKNMTTDNWIKGIVGMAISFSGAGDYIEADPDPWFDFKIRGFTLSFWIRQGQMNQPVVWLSNGFDPGQNNGAGYQVLYEPGQVIFRVSDGDMVSAVSVPDTHFVRDEWVHVAAVRDRETKQLILFANGAAVDSGADSTYDLSQEGPLFLGTTGALNSFFAGAMDDVRISNYSLSADDIMAMFQDYLSGVTEEKPRSFKIRLENYPNPFNPSTQISYAVPGHGKVSLKILNLQGQELSCLADGYRDAGSYKVIFDASRLGSGVYLCRLMTAGSMLTRKIMVVK